MNKTHWTRIIIATMLLAVLAGCQSTGQPSGGTQREESAFPR
jgi:hypothetical protein